MINVRFVNYFLNSNGSYHFPVNDNKIATVNKIYELDNEYNFIEPPVCLVPDNNNLRYVGIEDLKPYSPNGTSQLYFIGTCQNPGNCRISIGYGEFNLDTITSTIPTPSLKYTVVNTDFNKDCEKNWVFYGDCNVVYQWFPLMIGKIEKITDTPQQDTPQQDTPQQDTPQLDNKYVLKITEQKTMPPFFRNVRGSTHGYEFQNEVWFICHVVDYCQPREYYNLFAIFDKDTMTIKRWSNLFKFEGEKIEYTLGLIVEEKQIIISYSKWDREPAIGVYDKFKIEMELF